jgi:peptidoglycan/LPS O-acetylase OafA/YrhL
MVETVFYIILCLLTGLCGTYSRMGFVGTFLLALLLTPFAPLLVLGMTSRSRQRELQRREYEMPRAGS